MGWDSNWKAGDGYQYKEKTDNSGQPTEMLVARSGLNSKDATEDHAHVIGLDR